MFLINQKKWRVIKVNKIRCKRCNRVLKLKISIERGFGDTCYRIMKLNQLKVNKVEPEKLDMEEIKSFISLEIEKALKDFKFNRSVNNDNTKDIGIVPKRIKKMPKFNILEVSKRLVVNELKEQLAKGIKNNILHNIGSFDEQINFYKISEVPILV